MFLKIEYEGERGVISRLINLNQVVSMGEATGKYGDMGYKTVLFLPNGYAVYSKSTQQEILSAANIEVIQ